MSESGLDNIDNFRDLLVEVKKHINGQTPVDINWKCLDICKEFFTGIWTQLTIDDIEVKRLPGGMSNQTYLCRIVDQQLKCEQQPKEVVIRLYGPRFNWKTLEQTKDNIDEPIIALLASEHNLGPEVYGLFPGGQIQRHYQHRHFTVNDLSNPDLLSQYAIKLAQFHALKPPIQKNKSFFLDIMNACGHKWQQFLDNKRNLLNDSKCLALLDCHLKEEVNWVTDLIQKSEYPIVFSHSDYLFGNTLVTDGKVVLCDFETCAYTFRGYDFATVFTDFVELKPNTSVFRNEFIIKAFIEEYIKENQKLFGKQYSDKERNSVDFILRETKVFSMVYSLLATIFFLFNKQLYNIPLTEQSSSMIANSEFGNYLSKKNILTKLNIVKLA